MHPEILEEQQRKLLPFLSEFSSDFGMVGGTAIAYHIGHRRSIDFDLFTNTEFDNAKILSKIRKTFPLERVYRNETDQLTVLVHGVQLTFFRYPYPLEFPESFEGVVNIPVLSTLAAMKLFALGRRAKWKDYVDLYFVFKDQCAFRDVIQTARNMLGNEMNEKILREQLCYFYDIDFSETVSYLPGFETSDETVKEFLTKVSAA